MKWKVIYSDFLEHYTVLMGDSEVWPRDELIMKTNEYDEAWAVANIMNEGVSK